MSDTKNALPAPPHEILLALLDYLSRQLSNYTGNPPDASRGGISPEGIRTHVGRMYQCAESLVDLAEAARAKAQADAEKNGEAPADQVN